MRVVMMDVDGVLVRGRPSDGAHLFTDLERDLGLSRETLQSAFFATRWPEIVAGKLALRPQLAEVLSEVAPHVEVDALIQYWFANDSRIDVEVLDAIGSLRGSGARVLLATNQEHMRARYLMEEMGLGAHVDGIVYSAAIGHRKPSTAFYRAATEVARTDPSRVVLVDDTLENVEAARDFGWQALHWTDARTAAELTDFVASAS